MVWADTLSLLVSASQGDHPQANLLVSGGNLWRDRHIDAPPPREARMPASLQYQLSPEGFHHLGPAFLFTAQTHSLFPQTVQVWARS